MRKAISLSISALVLIPVSAGWLFGMVVFSFQAGYRSAAVTLNTWAAPKQ